MTLEESQILSIFSKGLSHGFGQNFQIFFFSLFFFIKGLNILFDYLQERKQPFPDYKDDIIKKSKKWDFFKGVNPWYWSNFSNFLSVCFSLK